MEVLLSKFGSKLFWTWQLGQAIQQRIKPDSPQYTQAGYVSWEFTSALGVLPQYLLHT